MATETGRYGAPSGLHAAGAGWHYQTWELESEDGNGMNVIRRILAHPLIALQGFLEGSGDVGITYDNDTWSPRSLAYDTGRNLRLRGK